MPKGVVISLLITGVLNAWVYQLEHHLPFPLKPGAPCVSHQAVTNICNLLSDDLETDASCPSALIPPMYPRLVTHKEMQDRCGYAQE